MVDPSHYERSHDTYGRLPQWLTLEELLLKSQAPDPKWSPWTFELIQAVLGEYQERGDRLSTTALVSACPRAAVIERMEPYIGTLDGLYAALRGTMVHRTLEAYARQGAIAEHRFFATIDGIEISGSPDLVTTSTVFDYKVPTDQSGVPPFGYPFRHQTEQLMMNAFILRHAEHWQGADGELNPSLPFDPREERATGVAIVYLAPKGPKVIQYNAKQIIVTPAGHEREVNRPYVWNDEQVLAGYDDKMRAKGGMRARLHLMEAAFAAYPEWPEPWTNPDDGETYTFEHVFGGPATWVCPGPPLCKLPTCTARTLPGGYVWENE
jgi:hypothetical protein